MKPFVFRLESILQLRAREEARAQEVFEQAMRVVSRAEFDLSTAREELGRMEQAICEQRGGRAKLTCGFVSRAGGRPHPPRWSRHIP